MMIMWKTKKQKNFFCDSKKSFFFIHGRRGEFQLDERDISNGKLVTIVQVYKVLIFFFIIYVHYVAQKFLNWGGGCLFT